MTLKSEYFTPDIPVISAINVTPQTNPIAWYLPSKSVQHQCRQIMHEDSLHLVNASAFSMKHVAGNLTIFWLTVDTPFTSFMLLFNNFENAVLPRNILTCWNRF